MPATIDFTPEVESAIDFTPDEEAPAPPPYTPNGSDMFFGGEQFNGLGASSISPEFQRSERGVNLGLEQMGIASQPEATANTVAKEAVGNFVTAPLVGVGKMLGVSGQTLADAVDAAGAYAGSAAMGTSALSSSSKAPIPSDFVQQSLEGPNRPPSSIEKMLAGSQQAVVESLDFFTSPLGIATLGIGAMPKAAQTATALAFTTDMMAKSPQQFRDFLAAVKTKDPESISKAAVGLGLTGTFIAGGATHSAKGLKAGIEEIGYANRVRRGVNLQDQPKPVELGDQFSDAPREGVAGVSFSPITPIEQARRLGLTQTAEAASKVAPQSREDLNSSLAAQAEQLGLVQPKESKATIVDQKPGVIEWKRPVPLGAKEGRELVKRAEARADLIDDPGAKADHLRRWEQIKFDLQATKRELQDAKTAGEKYMAEDLILELENELRRLSGEQELVIRQPVTAEMQAKATPPEPKGGEKQDGTQEKEGVQVAPAVEPPASTTQAVASIPLPEIISTSTMTLPNGEVVTQNRVKAKGTGEETTVSYRGTADPKRFEDAWKRQQAEQARQENQGMVDTQTQPAQSSQLDTLLESQKGGGNNVDSARIAEGIRAEGESGIAKVNASMEKSRADAKALLAKAKTPAEKIAVMESPEYRSLTQRNQILDEAIKYEDGRLKPNMPEAVAIIEKLSPRQEQAKTPAQATQTPNATQPEVPVVSPVEAPTGTPAPVAEGTPGGGGQPVGTRPETPQAQTQALTPESPVSPVVPPKPPPTTPPIGDYDRPAGSPIGIRNAEIDKLRAEMGMEPIAKAAGLPDKTLWQQVMDRIEREKDWIDTVISDIKKTGRGHTNEEALGLTHRLVETRTEFYKESRKAAKARDAGDVVAEAQAKVNVNFWSDKLVELEQIVTSSGSTLGSAFRARQFMMNEDFSLAALELKKRKAKDWKPLNDAERSEIEKTHAEYVAKTEALETHLAEESGKRVDAEIKLAAAEAARGPDYDPQLLKIVESVASFMDKAADAARARLEARRKSSGGKLLSSFTGGIEAAANVPDYAIIIADSAVVGAAKIARKINDFKKWSDAMVKDLGEWITPHLNAVWEASKAQVPKSVEESLKSEKPATKSKVKAAITGQDVAEKIESAKDKIAAKVEKKQQNAIYYQVQELVRGIVERDLNITRGQLINEVHGVLKEFIPDIKKMDTMDAITGVGRFTVPKTDIVSRAVRELRTQTRLASHFIRVLMKEHPPRTGYQHGKPSDVSRSLTRRINEAKRKFPLEPSDPESQLGSVLQARKTYYTNRLTDLKLEISRKERLVKSKTASPTDPELDALKAEYETVKREHDEIFGRPEITEAQKLERLESSATRRIAELERQLKMDEVFAKGKKKTTVSSEKLVAQKARIDALVAEREYVRMRMKPDPGMDPFVLAIIHARARMTRQLADYTKRVADGDYAPRTKKPPVDITQDKLAMSIMADLTKVKREFDKGLALDEAKKRTKFVKFMAGTGEVLNINRALWSSYDLSALGRQGAIMLMSHPIRSSKAVIPMLKALVSEKSALIEEQKIINRPNYQNGNYAKSDLYLASLDEFRLTRREEIQMSNYSNLIPGVRASNRAFMTYLNKVRADSFDVMLKSRERWFSKPVEQFEKDAIANYINISTGRGYLGNHAAAAQTLATIFWAPRLMTSRIQYLVGQPMWKGGARVRAMVAREYAQTLMGMGAVIGLAKLAGAEVETDPNSSDFLKLKFGNARVDIMGGLLQNIVFLNRLLVSGKIKTASGKEKPAKGGDLIWDFSRNKLTPLLGTGLDVRDLAFGQKPPAGHPQSLSSLVLNLPVPLSYRDVLTMLKEEGVPATTALSLVSTLGWGVQYYDAQAGEKKVETNTPYSRAMMGAP
jgi:hypothetical protein